MSQCDFRLDKNDHPSAWPASLQSAAGPREPSPGDYCLMATPGAPAHLEAMLLGWRFSHAVIYVGDGHLVKAWFDRVREPTSITGTARFMPATFYILCRPQDYAAVALGRLSLASLCVLGPLANSA